MVFVDSPCHMFFWIFPIYDWLLSLGYSNTFCFSYSGFKMNWTMKFSELGTLFWFIISRMVYCSQAMPLEFILNMSLVWLIVVFINYYCKFVMPWILIDIITQSYEFCWMLSWVTYDLSCLFYYLTGQLLLDLRSFPPIRPNISFSLVKSTKLKILV